ncbi:MULTISPECIES: aromatic amino acid ammonia-lyase [Chelativorans]|jgi:histidine ammonia-lyase|uniref:Phenylalanine/histidine ammonia-lyase n=1 Tax=Chelativorans sp. (strain BNC1) TaxID=266779 RepID=Q11F20_CHESB|nr:MULTISPECIES: aromatic amino acid ammonia-lyase [Chelativorans]
MLASRTVLELKGKPFSFAQLASIAAGKVELTADDEAMRRVRAARRVLEDHIAAGHPVYGATTGVGAMKDVSWTAADQDLFNFSLVHAHSFGTGETFSPAVIRSAMAIRINMALNGHVGVSGELVDIYLAMMRADLVPVVRRTGSIGCADIGLMGQIGAVLTGAGEVYARGHRMPAELALSQAGIVPMIFAPRDSLASISTNAIAYAAAAHAIREAAGVFRMALAVGLTSAGALGASRDPWLAASQLDGACKAIVGAWLYDNAEVWGWSEATHVQDPLSLRMMAQVFGAAFDGLVAAGRTILAATGRTDDNPVVVNGRVLTSGGSLPLDVTLFLQTAQLAIAHVARNGFNRCVLLGNGGRRGLPVNLVPHGEIATGMGPVIKLAGALFARVLSLASPVSAQIMVLADGQEDEATFLPLVVERLEQQVSALRQLAALEGVLTAQAIDITGDAPKGVAKLIYDLVRTRAGFQRADRPLSQEIEAIESGLAAEASMAGLLSLASLPEIDGFFALDPSLSS